MRRLSMMLSIAAGALAATAVSAYALSARGPSAAWACQAPESLVFGHVKYQLAASATRRTKAVVHGRQVGTSRPLERPCVVDGKQEVVKRLPLFAVPKVDRRIAVFVQLGAKIMPPSLYVRSGVVIKRGSPLSQAALQLR